MFGAQEAQISCVLPLRYLVNKIVMCIATRSSALILPRRQLACIGHPLFFWVLIAWLAPLATASPPLDFNSDIRPILSNHCFQCHGPDKSHRKADLRLDVRDEALRKKAFVPGKPDESALVSRIFASSAEDLMPPAELNKPLMEGQRQLLRRWIAEGAPYTVHWAYAPITKPEPPRTRREGWRRNPIDAFVLSRLESQNLEPSKEADNERLARRVSLDLLGVLPERSTLESFLADSSPRGYERLVDKLLDSPHYGERMAVPWLDLVRFADSVGYHGDQGQRIFPYRDYVIDAFNQNLPFDRFTIEQIAGDLVPEATEQSRIASGFNRLNMMTREGGAQPKEYLAKYSADRVRTVAVTWLGSTMGCAECHDHKYDPFTTQDFYSFAAFFADVKQWGVYQDYSYTPNPELKGFSNDHPWPPEIIVISDSLLRRKARVESRILEAVSAAEARSVADPTQRDELELWRQESLAFLGQCPTGWHVPRVTETAAECEPQADGSVLFLGEPKVVVTKPNEPKPGEERKLEFTLEAGRIASIRLEALPHPKHSGKIVRGSGSSASIRLSATLRRDDAKKDEEISFLFADADAKDPVYFNGELLAGVHRGWTTRAARSTEPQTAVWLLDRPVRVVAGEKLVVSVVSDTVGCVRVSVSPFVPELPREAEFGETFRRALEARPQARSAEHRRLLHKAWLFSTAASAETHRQLQAGLLELLEIGDAKAFTMVTQAVEPLTVRVLPRGNWQDESGAVVEPSVPAFLAQAPAQGRRLTRLDLARWIVSSQNPLTARVFVNRLWKLFMGAGLSASVDDVGAQGEAPSHPELLDWLSSEFISSGWDVKHMVKLMVLSSTYRQGSSLRPSLRDIDPQNRLLSSQNPRRLEAEFVRDNALAIAGLLNLDVGGPSARPYQPAGYYANIQFPDRDYTPQMDDRQYRRGVYTHWQRTFLHPMFANFDAPSREECTAARVVSNTPQQALTLLNDPTFVEAARSFAAHLLSMKSGKPGGDGELLDEAFKRALARPASGKERPSLMALLGDQRAHYAANAEEARKLLAIGNAPNPPGLAPAELAAWTNVCRVILNLHETITRY